ncbi:MAG: hypothetical protein U0793_14850 [Gemmataceae bacterium]
MLRNRIKDHRRVRAGDLVPHELNPRTHTDLQRRALQMLYDEIGFARSLLAYELPDGRLKLIDGHLRRDMTPDELVDVEVLDVSDAEARALLLAIDPLAQLAGYEAGTLAELRRIAEADSAAARSLWEVLQDASKKTRRELDRTRAEEAPAERYLVLIECEDEEQQRDLLERFAREGLTCHAKMG